MRNRSLSRLATRVSLVLPARPVTSGAATIVLLAFSCLTAAQGAVPDGEYAAVFKGKVYYTDRQPAEQQVVEQTILRISSSGNNVTIDVGQLGSAMSATRFHGTIGNARFVAMQSVPGNENQAKLLWGVVQSGNTLRGTLLYPRVADGLVPGYTELQFEAMPDAGSMSNSSSSSPTPQSRRPSSSLTPSSSASSGLDSGLPRTSLPSDSSGSTASKPKKELKPRQPTTTAGSSVISGTVTGDIGVVLNIQLVDARNEDTLKTTTLDRNGRYRFENVGAGQYWVYVNDGRAEAYISTTSGERSVNADGRSSYRVNFNVRN